MKLMELVLLLCRRTKGLQNKALEYRIVSAGASIVSVFSCAVHPSQRPVHVGDYVLMTAASMRGETGEGPLGLGLQDLRGDTRQGPFTVVLRFGHGRG